ncbi:MAG: hypothetical protein NXI14_06795 [bacterium]|nr:hypothetical protein [bacterium]
MKPLATTCAVTLLIALTAPTGCQQPSRIGSSVGQFDEGSVWVITCFDDEGVIGRMRIVFIDVADDNSASGTWIAADYHRREHSDSNWNLPLGESGHFTASAMDDLLSINMHPELHDANLYLLLPLEYLEMPNAGEWAYETFIGAERTGRVEFEVEP